MKYDNYPWTEANRDKSGLTHFDDDRFCGLRKWGRLISYDENKITCPKCLANDRLVLTEQGKQALRDLGYTVKS